MLKVHRHINAYSESCAARKRTVNMQICIFTYDQPLAEESRQLFAAQRMQNGKVSLSTDDNQDDDGSYVRCRLNTVVQLAQRLSNKKKSC